MRILVVEDDTRKLGRIVACIRSVDGIRLDDIEECRFSSDARRKLRAIKYDVLVLDINIPDQLGEEPKVDGGVRLMEELLEDDHFIVPDHILGISAFDDSLNAAADAAFRHDWQVLQFRAESEDWA